MDEGKTWTNDEIVSLISSFEEYPELWDTNNDGNKNKCRKDECWRALGEKFSCTDKEVQRKMHNLRTQFSQEFRKMAKKKSTSGANETSKWKFFTHLTFLVAVKRKAPAVRNWEESSPSPSTIVSDSSAVRSPMPASTARSVPKTVGAAEKNERVVAVEAATPEQDQFRKRKSEDEDKIVRKTLRVFEEPAKDRISTFGEFVAAEVRNLRCTKNQNGLMREIQESIIQWSQLDDNMQT